MNICSYCHAERKKPLALSEQKLALSVAEWVEGEASGIRKGFEILRYNPFHSDLSLSKAKE